MALINCPECDYLVSEKARACVNCGYPVYDESQAASRKPELRSAELEKSPPNLRSVSKNSD